VCRIIAQPALFVQGAAKILPVAEGFAAFALGFTLDVALGAANFTLGFDSRAHGFALRFDLRLERFALRFQNFATDLASFPARVVSPLAKILAIGPAGVGENRDRDEQGNQQKLHGQRSFEDEYGEGAERFHQYATFQADFLLAEFLVRGYNSDGLTELTL
jgi:hypothetical protein